MKPTRAGHRRREDVPHRRRGGAVGEGFVVTTAATGQAGLAAWQREPCDLVILDRHLPDTDGIAVLEAMTREARERGVDTLVVDRHRLRRRRQRGAGAEAGRVRLPVEAAAAARARGHRAQGAGGQAAARAGAPAGRRAPRPRWATSSPAPSAAMRKVIDMVDKVAEATDTTVLIQGESGTGKELIADLIAPPHAAAARTARSSRSTARRCPRTCWRASCSATSAAPSPTPRRRSAGLFEEADGGTLFLDEVGEMPVAHAGQAAARCWRR